MLKSHLLSLNHGPLGLTTTLVGIVTLMTFVLITFGVENGNLGVECNTKYSDNLRPCFPHPCRRLSQVDLACLGFA